MTTKELENLRNLIRGVHHYIIHDDVHLTHSDTVCLNLIKAIKITEDELSRRTRSPHAPI